MAAPRRTLYSDIEPFTTGFLERGIHKLYYEEVGNPTGKPIVFLHGGPGGGISAFNRCYFDPQVYRIVLFDQRGCGKSTPTASLEDNTTWHLVDDIEALREHLKIDKWVVFGGSWGSTLALAYAEKYTDRVKALVLRGIFMLRREELLWFYQEGASWLFPDVWEKYLAVIPEVERGDLMSAYHRRLTGTDEEVKAKAAAAWTEWELTTSRLQIDPTLVERALQDTFSLCFARIENHFFVNGGFFTKPNQLLEDAVKLKDIPTTIVQGRYDVVCPAKSAWDLKKAMPHAEFFIVPDAGHSAKEEGIVHHLVEATDKYRDL